MLLFLSIDLAILYIKNCGFVKNHTFEEKNFLLWLKK